MNDELVVTDGARDMWGIAWWVDEEGDFGASIGEAQSLMSWSRFCHEPHDGLTLLEVRMWWECERLATECLSSGTASRIHDEGCIYWLRRRHAEACLSDAKKLAEAFMVSGGQDVANWPQWAQEALKHGWPAPEGWTP